MRYATTLAKTFCLLLMLVSVTPFTQAQDAGWYKYDFSQKDYSRICPKATKNGVKDNMQRIRTATKDNPAVIAHRGVYSKELPTTNDPDQEDLFAAENTVLAFQHAQCLGYPGVEVDLKYTDSEGAEKNAEGQRRYDLSSNSELILAHDENLMRFTNFGCQNSLFDLDTSAQIVDGKKVVDGKEVDNIVREKSSRTCPRIRVMQASNLKNNLSYMQTYDEDGAPIYKPDEGHRVNYIHQNKAADGKSLFLRYVLEKAKNDSTLNRLIWVLDIQNYPTLELALKIVRDLNAWDRVIFKLWTEALPIIPSGRFIGDDFVFEQPTLPQEANFVIAINPMNTKLDNGNLKSHVWRVHTKRVPIEQEDHGAHWFIPGIHSIEGHSKLIIDMKKSNEGYMDTNALITLLHNPYFNLHTNFLGFEFLVDKGQSEVDTAILALVLETSKKFHQLPQWGVLRVADYICTGFEKAGPCLLSKGQNLYGTAQTDGDTSWVRLYTEKPETIAARKQHGLKSAVRTQDIRGEWDPDFVSPNKITAIHSQLR